MVISELLKNGVEILKQNNIETPILDAQLLLAHTLDVDKLYIMTNGDKEVSNKNQERFINELNKRAKGMPLQYITEIQEFMGMKFKVNENVLIPRPDTEILIEEILKNVDLEKKYNILDIGTGSGCISISLAKYLKNSDIYTVDISKEATEVAKHNAKINGVEEKIKFFNGDIFEPFDQNKNFFDIIVSNPPYIPTKVVDTLDTNVKDYEPSIALDGGADGLDFYREIISKSSIFFEDKGAIFLEIGYDQANDVTSLLQTSKFFDINIVNDLAGRNRVVTGKLNK